jgi:hypothetical protein
MEAALAVIGEDAPKGAFPPPLGGCLMQGCGGLVAWRVTTDAPTGGGAEERHRAPAGCPQWQRGGPGRAGVSLRRAGCPRAAGMSTTQNADGMPEMGSGWIRRGRCAAPWWAARPRDTTIDATTGASARATRRRHNGSAARPRHVAWPTAQASTNHAKPPKTCMNTPTPAGKEGPCGAAAIPLFKLDQGILGRDALLCYSTTSPDSAGHLTGV